MSGSAAALGATSDTWSSGAFLEDAPARGSLAAPWAGAVQSSIGSSIAVILTQNHAMSDLASMFVNESRRSLSADLAKIEKALDGLSPTDVWWRPNEASNSIGNLILHLCGNIRQWIIGGVGARPYERDRPREFSERTSLPTNELLDRLRAVVGEADAVIGAMTAD